MIRILLYLLLLAAVAYGADWLLQRPGHVDVVWLDYHVTASAALVFVAVLLLGVLIALLWNVLSFIFGLPSLMALASRQRRREKGYNALSRGLIAAGSGDARAAARASAQASKHLRDDPLALILQAQAARLSGDGSGAEAAFGALAQREDTRVLGLRGLHDEASRRGDKEAARHFAGEAHATKPLPWSAQKVLEDRAAAGDWEQALAIVDTSASANLIDRVAADRQRAVLETAIGLDKEAVSPDAALSLARSAMKRAPDLVPAVALAARLLTRRGEIRKAAKLIENAWPRCSHPELARAYLDVRPGDSTSDRLARAQTLMRMSSFDPVSRMAVARAAIAAKDFAAARDAMAPLVAEGKRPTVRACLLMADLEDAEHGDLGQWREWLARASRAPLDAAWVADGIVYDAWEPASPTTGQLDAFVWQAPADRQGQVMEAMPAPRLSEPVRLRAPETAPETQPAHEPAEVEPVAPLEETARPAWTAPAPPAPITGTDGDNDAGALIAVPVNPLDKVPPKAFTRSVIVAPDDPGIDLVLKTPAKPTVPHPETTEAR